MNEEVRVRFPPSPTGYLHIGGARTALLNWLWAKKNNGKLILRIEDTDTERSTQESIDGILDGLKWLGLDWDEGPYFQTDFNKEHIKAGEKLIESGHAYKCFCSRDELDKKREAALAAKGDLRYDGTCRNLSEAEIKAKEEKNIPYVIRFKVEQNTGQISYQDKALGNIERQPGEIEDFVIVRSNGQPLYLLCNVVDDIRDRISHVIRGQDHMTNTIKQILLYRALGAPEPVFAHLPLTLDLQKRKISKRSHGEIVSVQFYREKGFLPWALCNYLALLGWNPGTDQEVFSRQEMIEAFTLERISKVNSVFNYQKGNAKFFTDPKLISFNEHYLRSMDIEELAPLVKKELMAENLWEESYETDKKEWFLQTLDLIRERFHTLKDFVSLGRAYFSDDYPIAEKPLKKNILKHPELKKWLPALADKLSQLDSFDEETCESITRQMAEELDIKPGILINGMRTVLSGQAAGPSLFKIVTTLGRKRVVARLKDIEKLYSQDA